jgi:hypothetical protein
MGMNKLLAMKRVLAVMIVLFYTRTLWAQAPPEADNPTFKPAQTLTVSDILIPSSCAVNGTVVIDALIVEEGKPKALEVRRDIDCLTQIAMDAVKDWTFSPATVKDKPVASRIAVAVTFCPIGSTADSLATGTLKSQSDEAIQAEFQPPEPLHGKFPVYPMDATTFGTVVLEVNVNAKGEAGTVKVLRDLPPFTSHSQDAAGDWNFIAATDNGDPISTKVVMAFVFPPLPPSNNTF